MSANYADFVARKLGEVDRPGIDAHLRDYAMFPHQQDLTAWALRRGRAAIFADTGLGKSRMQIGWADMVHKEAAGDVLILAPLAVAEQTVEEGGRVGVNITHARDDADVRPGLNITNYDRLHRFDPCRFVGIVLDESSIIKHHDAKTLAALLGFSTTIPYRLACTATPAPNDWTELGNHAEFLGVRSRAEMLAEFFCHDGGETQVWRLKGHARAAFWQWVASWGALVRSPADLGHDASAYELPSLHVHQHSIEIPHDLSHGLFAMDAQTLMERRQARRDSLVDRVRACADIVNADCEPWVVWCDLNAEGDALAAAIPDAIQIAGADPSDVKERRLADFAHGRARVRADGIRRSHGLMGSVLPSCSAHLAIRAAARVPHPCVRQQPRRRGGGKPQAQRGRCAGDGRRNGRGNDGCRSRIRDWNAQRKQYL